MKETEGHATHVFPVGLKCSDMILAPVLTSFVFLEQVIKFNRSVEIVLLIDVTNKPLTA